MSDRFNNKDGSLTAYAFACGYLQQAHAKTKDISTTLWHESSHYHVRTHDHGNKGRLAWEVFTSLTEARKEFARQKRMYLRS